MECVITVELGTNATRVFAFDMAGNVIGSAKGSYPTLHTQPHYSEQDPEQIFITMLYVLKNLLSESYLKDYTVVTIAFSASMHSLLCIDKNGVPLGNAITWADTRAQKEAKELNNTPLGNAIYQATGTPIHPMSPLIKLAWMKKHDPEKFDQTAQFLSIKTYIIQQITGEYVIDYSLASATGLLNIHTLEWEPEALKYAGITEEKLPKLVPIYYSKFKLRKAYQTSLGLSAKTKIIIGSSDGCMAALGAGIWGEKKATITVEDSGAMRVVGKQVLHDDQQRFFNYLLTKECFISGGPTNNGGVIFEWFAHQFGDFKKAFDMEHCMENLINDASKVAPGAEGLIFLPYLLGERAPIWNANARGAYFGINIKHEQKHFIRATIEGILYAVYSIGKTLLEYREIESLSVNGSFGTIPFCAQMIADIFNKPVQISKNTDSASLGSFLMAGVEMGLYKNIGEAAKTIELTNTYLPNLQNHVIYTKYFSLFERLSTKLFDEFEEITKLQQQ